MGQLEHVTTPFTLAAFIAAAIVVALRHLINRDRRLIQTASEKDRARLVERVLGKVETGGMTSLQKYQLALEDLKARSRRFLITAIVIIMLMLVAGTISIIALTGRGNALRPDDQGSTSTTIPPSPSPAAINKPAPNLEVRMVSALLIWPKVGLDTSKYTAEGWPSISEDQRSEIRDFVQSESFAQSLKSFFSSGSISSPEVGNLTFRVWDDGDGFPDKDSILVEDGNLDSAFVYPVTSAIAAKQFPVPKLPRIRSGPVLPGVDTWTSYPPHNAYFKIAIQLQVTLP